MAELHPQVCFVLTSPPTDTDQFGQALVLYDYALTLDMEIELFWDTSSKGATVLFVVNRYLTLILRVVNLLGFLPMSDQVCLEDSWL